MGSAKRRIAMQIIAGTIIAMAAGIMANAAYDSLVAYVIENGAEESFIAAVTHCCFMIACYFISAVIILSISWKLEERQMRWGVTGIVISHVLLFMLAIHAKQQADIYYGLYKMYVKSDLLTIIDDWDYALLVYAQQDLKDVLGGSISRMGLHLMAFLLCVLRYNDLLNKKGSKTLPEAER